MIRVTTNGVLKKYRSNLNTSMTSLSKSRDMVLTQRYFNSFGEDPAAATQAFQLRRSWNRTSAQYTVSQSTYSKFNQAWQTLGSVDLALDTDSTNSTALEAALAGASDPTAAGRNSLGSQLTQLAETITQTMNARYGDDYVFSGADGKTVPFVWSGSDLYYRGVNVNASPNATATMVIDEGEYATAADLGRETVGGKAISDLFTATTEDGSVVDLTDTSRNMATNEVIILTAKDTGAADSTVWSDLSKLKGTTAMLSGDDGSEYQKLEAMANEKNFVDIGIGMEEDEDGNLIETSAFNDALQGISYLGYGLDEDGDPKNIACIVMEMGNILKRCDADGNWASSDDREDFQRLLGKFEEASSDLKQAYAEMDTKADFLKDNTSQLSTTADTLNEQFLDIEQCDLADAITEFSWAQYCYNAALKVGNSILSQSLMDYLD